MPRPRGVRQRELGSASASACTPVGRDLREHTRPNSARQRRKFQTAANDIVTLDATKVGSDGVKKTLQNLETAAGNLWAAAQDAVRSQGAELQSAIASLKGTVAGLTDQDSLSTNLGKIAASVAGVEQAAKPIMDSVRTGCPSVPPAETPPAS